MQGHVEGDSQQADKLGGTDLGRGIRRFQTSLIRRTASLRKIRQMVFEKIKLTRTLTQLKCIKTDCQNIGNTVETLAET